MRLIVAWLALGTLLTSGVVAAQSVSVSIIDSTGNTTLGTINNGNVFFHDSNGHTTSGAIHDGHVFLSTESGEVTVGTVRQGNVFLTDSKGVTTGTIRDGNIYLLGSDGSVTTGRYDSHGNAQTLTTTSSVNWRYRDSLACYSYGTTEQCVERGTFQRYANAGQQQFETNFAAGQAVGDVIGGLIRVWLEHRHQLSLERKDLCQQIREYYGEAFQAADDAIQEQYALIDVYERLARLDPSRATSYEIAADGCRTLSSTLKKFRSMTEQNLPIILAAKDLKYLREAADLARKYYDLNAEGSKRSFVFHQLMEGWAGFFYAERHIQQR